MVTPTFFLCGIVGAAVLQVFNIEIAADCGDDLLAAGGGAFHVEVTTGGNDELNGQKAIIPLSLFAV